MMRRASVLMACLTVLSAGCSGKRNPRDLLAPREVGTIIVDGRLIVGQLEPDIFLRTTQSPSEPYHRDAAALHGARALVFTDSGDTLFYRESFAEGGRYFAYDMTPGFRAVLPNTTYHLRVEATDGRIVTAETTTPARFTVRDWLLLDDSGQTVRHRLATYGDFSNDPDSVYLVASNQLVYQDGLLEARFDRANAIGYQVGIYSLDEDSPTVIDADFLSEHDLANLARNTSSPTFDAPDGFLRLPWFAIFFEGRYQINIYSVDRNWYDLTRSTDFFGNNNIGFGTNAGDDFERPIFHINGGIGFFGSASYSSAGFTVLPRP